MFVYFGCGLASGVMASDTSAFISAAVQRALIILLPVYACVYFAKGRLVR